ncbi:MAG TPA: kinase [Rudaea sp.]
MPRNASTQEAYPAPIVGALLAALTVMPPPRPWLIGLSGLQGSGKSTLAAQLVEAARMNAVTVLSMSIDDFYFGRAARKHLARTIHPLLATRGVPGTHDIELLMRTLDDLCTASPVRPACIPRFDKGRDTRVPPSRWREVRQRPDLIVLDGWCVGVPPQSAAALRRPINTLEETEDADARWRTWVNEQLAAHYVPLWERLDRLVLLQAPDFDVVSQWRDQQERALRQNGAPHAMSPAVLRRFVMHYERLSRQALKELPARADIRIVLDEQRRVRRVIDRR